jgi:hypothetical protein
MPGHVGTDIVRNSLRGRGLPDPEQMTHAQLEDLVPAGLRPEGATPEDLRKLLIDASDGFRDKAPVSAAQAAEIILDGVHRYARDRGRHGDSRPGRGRCSYRRRARRRRVRARNLIDGSHGDCLHR